MSFRFYIIFHKFLTEVAYEKLNKIYLERYCNFVAVNTSIRDKQVPEPLKHLVFEERQLPNYNPFMQHNKFCESSVFFHVANNPEILLDPYEFVGFLQYDMVLENSLFQNIEAAIQTLENPQKILFVHFAENSRRHLDQAVGLDGWAAILDLYNRTFKTKHVMDSILQANIPLYHCYMIPKAIFKKMMKFAEKSIPLLFYMLGNDTRHLPYHIERSHGIFLVLQTLDGHLDRWIQMPGIEHRNGIKDPWQQANEIETVKSQS